MLQTPETTQRETRSVEDLEWELLDEMRKLGFVTAGGVEIYMLSGSLTMNSANWDVARFDVGNEDADAFVWSLVDVARHLQRQFDAHG